MQNSLSICPNVLLLHKFYMWHSHFELSAQSVRYLLSIHGDTKFMKVLKQNQNQGILLSSSVGACIDVVAHSNNNRDLDNV